MRHIVAPRWGPTVLVLAVVLLAAACFEIEAESTDPRPRTPSRGEAGVALNRAIHFAFEEDFDALCERAAADHEQCVSVMNELEDDQAPGGLPDVQCHVELEPDDAARQEGVRGARVIVLEGTDARDEPYHAELVAHYVDEYEETRLVMPVWWVDFSTDQYNVSGIPTLPSDPCADPDAEEW